MKLDTQRVTWRQIDGELVILDLAASTYLTTNETGTILLKELVEERSLEELVEVLMAAFDVSQEIADDDVRAFVKDLGRTGLLEQASQLEGGDNDAAGLCSAHAHQSGHGEGPDPR